MKQKTGAVRLSGVEGPGTCVENQTRNKFLDFHLKKEKTTGLRESRLTRYIGMRIKQLLRVLKNGRNL